MGGNGACVMSALKVLLRAAMSWTIEGSAFAAAAAAEW
jgi:hypothetical protein